METRETIYPKSHGSSPLTKLLGYSLVVFILLFISYIGLTIYTKRLPAQDAQSWLIVQTQFASIASHAWIFGRPMLQLIVVLVVVEWILSKLGITFFSREVPIEWNIQTIIALIVVSSFSIAALGGIHEGIGSLKDLALVVVGFYFGTQKRNEATISGNANQGDTCRVHSNTSTKSSAREDNGSST